MNPAAILALLSEQYEELVYARNRITELEKVAEEAEEMRKHIAHLEASGSNGE